MSSPLSGARWVKSWPVRRQRRQRNAQRPQNAARARQARSPTVQPGERAARARTQPQLGKMPPPVRSTGPGGPLPRLGAGEQRPQMNAQRPQRNTARARQTCSQSPSAQPERAKRSARACSRESAPPEPERSPSAGGLERPEATPLRRGAQISSRGGSRFPGSGRGPRHSGPLSLGRCGGSARRGTRSARRGMQPERAKRAARARARGGGPFSLRALRSPAPGG